MENTTDLPVNPTKLLRFFNRHHVIEAEDLVNKVYLAYYRHRKHETINYPVSYIWAVAIRMMKGQLIIERREYNRLDHWSQVMFDRIRSRSTWASAEGGVIKHQRELEAERRIERAGLTRLERRIVDLILQGLNRDEILALTGISDGSYRNLKHRAKVKLERN